jgi:hypothetical protein
VAAEVGILLEHPAGTEVAEQVQAGLLAIQVLLVLQTLAAGEAELSMLVQVPQVDRAL